MSRMAPSSPSVRLAMGSTYKIASDQKRRRRCHVASVPVTGDDLSGPKDTRGLWGSHGRFFSWTSYDAELMLHIWAQVSTLHRHLTPFSVVLLCQLSAYTRCHHSNGNPTSLNIEAEEPCRW
jgi:hypothetical protein